MNLRKSNFQEHCPKSGETLIIGINMKKLFHCLFIVIGFPILISVYADDLMTPDDIRKFKLDKKTSKTKKAEPVSYKSKSISKSPKEPSRTGPDLTAKKKKRSKNIKEPKSFNYLTGCKEICDLFVQEIATDDKNYWYSKYLKGQYDLLECKVVYAKLHICNDNKVDYISFIFTNKGDDVSSDRAKIFKIMEEKTKVRDAIRKESKTLEKKLSSLFGKSRSFDYGEGKVEERAEFWSKNDYIYILSSPKDEYTCLRIISKEKLKMKGNNIYVFVHIDRKKLIDNVKHRSNGDVVIDNIPMIDQESKGYCTPATWTRYLNYLGFYISMYTLAQQGTFAGGGTIPLKMKYTVNSILRPHRMKARVINTNLPKIKTVAEYIDQGLPVIWHKVGHTRMIIGYNKRNGKIAYSDSWGKKHKEKWMKVSDALKMTARYPMEVVEFR